MQREEAFRRVGLESFTMLAGDSADPKLMAARMHAARSRAMWAAPRERALDIAAAGMVGPDARWSNGATLDEGQRERLLRYALRTG